MALKTTHLNSNILDRHAVQYRLAFIDYLRLRQAERQPLLQLLLQLFAQIFGPQVLARLIHLDVVQLHHDTVTVQVAGNADRSHGNSQFVRVLLYGCRGRQQIAGRRGVAAGASAQAQ